MYVRRNLGLISFALLVMIATVALAIRPAVATNDISEANKVGYWCEDGIKYEPVETPFIVPAPPAGTTWTLLVLKGGTTNETVDYPVVGQGYSHSAHDNSHVILCWEEPSDTTTTSTSAVTTTVANSTTTTEVSDTTTTVPVTTTSSSTTTTVPKTTTTTSIPVTTTTTKPAITTTTMDPPTTTIPEVQTDIAELPTTGIPLTGIAVLGMMSLALGSAFVYSVRKAD